MNHIEELNTQTDLATVAYDLSTLLAVPDNVDISDEFPSSFERYSGDPQTVQDNLAETVRNCIPGTRQQFIAFFGPKAVGISAIRFADQVPKGVSETWPNVSGFICHPYRGIGLGTLSLQTRLAVVREQFNGNAWTQVKKINTASNKLVTHAGFSPISETTEHIIYTYRAQGLNPKI